MNKFTLMFLFISSLSFAAVAAEKEEDKGPSSTEIAEKLRKHCVEVRIWAKKDEGEDPSSGETGMDLANERASLTGGYMIDSRTIMLPDIVLHERFIRKIEVGSGKVRVAASIKGYYLDHQIVLLSLADDLPGVEPLVFVKSPERKEWGKMRAVNYAWQEGEWGITVTGALQGVSIKDNGASFVFGKASGILVNMMGEPVGATFSSRISENGVYPWTGESLKSGAFLPAEEKKKKFAEIEKRLSLAALEVKFTFRAKVEDGEREDSWNPDTSDNTPEVKMAGFLINPRQLMVPVSMPKATVKKIESITVTLGDGREVKAKFGGALKDFEVLLVDLGKEEKDLPGAISLGDAGTLRLGGLFLKANVGYGQGKRKVKLAYDRYRGIMRGYMDYPMIWTFTNENDGSIAFDLDGKILALSVAPRKKAGGEDNYRYRGDSGSGFQPVKVLSASLKNPNAIDKNIRPLGEKEEKKIVTLGVEWQGLTVDLAKSFNAEKATRGGQIGLLVVYVYPDTPAAKAGLQEEDILLRAKSPDKAEPIDLTAQNSYGGYRGRFFGGPRARSGYVSGGAWPNRDNALTRLLSQIGENKEVRIDYLRGGKEKSFTFTTVKGKPHFLSAPKHKSKALGVTVKPVTYEAVRFFRREDSSGVVVSRIEPGGRCSVAGMWLFQLITHINGEKVSGLDDYKTKIKPFEEGKEGNIELTLEIMGKTRLIKIEMKEPKSKKGE